MIFHPTNLEGMFEVLPERLQDERGYFARTFCRQEFASHGLAMEVAQRNISSNRHGGTLRGLHYQAGPHSEAKLVSCQMGSLWDVTLDLRPHSPTYKRHVALRLSADDGRMLYIPPGCAHGFLTLEDHTEVAYLMSEPYDPASERGVRWDDPSFDFAWPGPVRVISPRDLSYPDFTSEDHEFT